MLQYAAYAESRSNHPIALSILNAYGNGIDDSKIKFYEEVPGHGIITKIEDKKVSIGNERMMNREHIAIPETLSDKNGTLLHVGINGEYAGFITISDKIKDDAKATISEMRKLGIKKLVMLTGDSPKTGRRVGGQLGLDEVYSSLLPADKVEIIETLQKDKPSKEKLIFIGDGINDAPVLARADIGAAMGGLGSDAAIEAADIVLMTDEPSKLISAIKITKNEVYSVAEYIFFTRVKAVVLILGL